MVLIMRTMYVVSDPFQFLIVYQLLKPAHLVSMVWGLLYSEIFCLSTRVKTALCYSTIIIPEALLNKILALFIIDNDTIFENPYLNHQTFKVYV